MRMTEGEIRKKAELNVKDMLNNPDKDFLRKYFPNVDELFEYQKALHILGYQIFKTNNELSEMTEFFDDIECFPINVSKLLDSHKNLEDEKDDE